MAALLPLWGCGDAPPPLPEYVLDSGLDADSEEPVIWMDDRRVLAFGAIHGQRSLTIWDTESNLVTPYTPPGEITPGGRLCYDPVNGNVSYRGKDQNAEFVQVFGPLGAETVARVWGGPTDLIRNEYTCEEVRREGEFQNRSVEFLYAEHGALLFGPLGPRPGDDGRTKGGLITPDGRQVLTPIMEKRTYHPSCSKFYSHEGAYYMTRCGWDWQDFEGKNCYSAYWLWPDGRTEEVCLPEFKNTFVLPSKAGFVMDHRVVLRTGNADTGLNLYAHGVLWRVFDGFIGTNASLAPDGCRVAFTSARNYTEYDEGRHFTLKMADVCAADRTQLEPQR